MGRICLQKDRQKLLANLLASVQLSPLSTEYEVLGVFWIEALENTVEIGW